MTLNLFLKGKRHRKEKLNCRKVTCAEEYTVRKCVHASKP